MIDVAGKRSGDDEAAARRRFDARRRRDRPPTTVDLEFVTHHVERIEQVDLELVADVAEVAPAERAGHLVEATVDGVAADREVVVGDLDRERIAVVVLPRGHTILLVGGVHHVVDQHRVGEPPVAVHDEQRGDGHEQRRRCGSHGHHSGAQRTPAGADGGHRSASTR